MVPARVLIRWATGSIYISLNILRRFQALFSAPPPVPLTLQNKSGPQRSKLMNERGDHQSVISLQSA